VKNPSTEAKNQTKKGGGGMLLLLMSLKKHFLTTTIFLDAEIRIVYETNSAIRKHKEFKIQTVYET
jgi:hypothetical protein